MGHRSTFPGARVRQLLGAATVAVVAGLLTPASGRAEPCPPGAACSSGYIRMSDGVDLRYQLDRPLGNRRSPVALVYDGYCEGTNPLTCNDGRLSPALLEAGYAVLGVNVRGTGCSSGSFEPFGRVQIRDGAAVVEWAARQRWSTGRVGMYGVSFPGIMAYAVATKRPRGLVAVAPYQAIANLYRDVGRPGGIFNRKFAEFWGGGVQPGTSQQSAAHGAAEGDPRCRAALERLRAAPENRLLRLGLRYPFESAGARTHLLARRQWRRIRVPVLACLTWQDDELSSQWSDTFDDLDPRRLWVHAGNGYHGQCSQHTRLLVDFFDRFVRGARNGFDRRTPHVRLDHETRIDFGGPPTLFPMTEPAWSTSFPRWPVRTAATTLHLRAGERLARGPATRPERPDRYRYPLPSADQGAGLVENATGRQGAGWKAGAPTEGVLSYTTPRLARDAEFLGHARVDLWLATTARDTDIQVTLTEVRPDGQEMYVSRGWLRASRRVTDRRRSTALRPHHTFLRRDARPLRPGRPALLPISIQPFNHVFRAGSRIRLLIDAPTASTGGWGFDYLRTPATNTILHDRKHRSRLVLGLVRGGRAKRPYGPCENIANQPCRTNVMAVPDGRLVISPDRIG